MDKKIDINELLSKANQMRKSFEAKQHEAQAKKYESSVGGGMVKVIVNGKHEMIGISIENELIHPEKAEAMKELIVLAVNEALRKVKNDNEDAMRKAFADGMPDLSKMF